MLNKDLEAIKVLFDGMRNLSHGCEYGHILNATVAFISYVLKDYPDPERMADDFVAHMKDTIRKNLPKRHLN